DQEIHRAFRTDQERDRRAQGRQIRPGSRKERGPGAARSGAQRRKACSVQGKHRAGAKIFRQARAHYAGTRFEAATCGLEVQTGIRRTSHPRGCDGGVREKLAARVNRAGASERMRAFFLWIVSLPAARRRAGAAGACFAQSKMYAPNIIAASSRLLPRSNPTEVFLKTGVARRQSTGPADEVEISVRRAYGQLLVLPRAPPVGEAWQFSVKLQLAATAILLIGLRSSS